MKNYGLEKFADMHVHLSNLDFLTVESCLDLLCTQGITDITLQSLTYRAICYNLSVLYWKNHYKKANVSAYGMIHNMPNDIYNEIPFEDQAKHLLELGCDGIKLMFDPNTRKILGHGINDLRYDKMFAYLQSNNVPLCIHLNDPDYMWEERELTEEEIKRNWGYFRQGYLSKQQIYDEMFEVLDKYPNLKIVFSHFFFLSVDIKQAQSVLDKYPNVCYDLTPNSSMFVDFSKNIDEWREFFIKNQNRIVFGTDCNDIKVFNAELIYMVKEALSHDKSEFVMPCYSREVIRGLNLPKQALENICYYNYKRILPTVKPVNQEKFVKALNRVYQDCQKTGDKFYQDGAEWAKACLDRLNG